MSTLRPVGRSAAMHQNVRSASVRNHGHATNPNPSSRPPAAPQNSGPSVCLFTFSDGRRCRTPRSGSHPHFCFYHARKESQAQVAQKLGNDFHYLFSGEYVSACDLTSALGRLFPAVARGDIKPRTASTLAYLAQTLVQALHLAQHEYINAFGTDGWRQTVRNSVNLNFDYGNPAPTDNPAQTPAQAPAPIQPQAQPQPPSPHHSPSASTATAAPTAAPFAATSAPVSASASTSEACHPERSEGSSLNPIPSNSGGPEPSSTPAPSINPSATPPPDPSQPGSSPEETPAQAAALAIARSLFPRRRTNPSPNSATASNYANSFRTNIYDPSRSC
jgi:hypothetical protein